MKETVKLKESQLRDIVRESIVSILSEKAKSKSQQRFFGMVDAYKKGELDDASPAVKKAAKGMTNKEVKDFAKTKHKGLPNHVDESALANAIQESIKKVLGEGENPNTQRISALTQQYAQLQRQIEAIKYSNRYTYDQKVRMQDKILNQMSALKDQIKRLNGGVMAWN